MATDIIARGMITEYKSGTNIDFKENEDGSVTISASGDVSSEDTVARDTIDNHKLDKNNPHNVTAEQVGLGNVNNTADLDKPISTAVQTALDDKANSKHTHNKSDITDFPNSLPANGGNADTVDGFHVAEYVTTLPEGEYYTEVARINTRGKKIESCDTSNLKVGLADYATNADYAMNSNTVNNHTVDSDVPANAVFTDTTNSDVTASGNPVILDGLQGGVPFSEMAVSGKNLISNKYTPKSGSINSTIDENGIVTVSTTNPFSGNNTPVTVNTEMLIPIGVLNRDCTIGITWIDGLWRDSDSLSKWLGVNISFLDNDKKVITGATKYISISNGVRGLNKIGKISNKTLEIPESAEYFSINFWISSGTYLSDFKYALQLEIGDTATAYEPPITGRELTVNVNGTDYTIIPDSNPYTVPNDIRQQDGLNVVSVSEGEISVTGVRKNAAVKKIWDKIGMDLLFDGTVTAGTNCITENVNGYNFLYFYGNLSSVSGESGNVTGSLVIPKTARAISAGQSLVVTTGVIYITVNIINIDSGVITFTVTPSDSSREIYEFKVFGIK